MAFVISYFTKGKHKGSGSRAVREQSQHIKDWIASATLDLNQTNLNTDLNFKWAELVEVQNPGPQQEEWNMTAAASVSTPILNVFLCQIVQLIYFTRIFHVFAGSCSGSSYSSYKLMAALASNRAVNGVKEMNIQFVGWTVSHVACMAECHHCAFLLLQFLNWTSLNSLPSPALCGSGGRSGRPLILDSPSLYVTVSLGKIQNLKLLPMAFGVSVSVCACV